MKKVLFLLALLLCATSGVFAQKAKSKDKDAKPSAQKTEMAALAGSVTNAAPGVILKNEQDSASYAFGQLVGRNFARQFPHGLNTDLVLQAMSDMLHDKAPVFDDQTANTCYSDYAEKVKAEEDKANSAAYADVKKAGEDFLEQNKKRPGVTVTASGLQYEVLKRGDGTVSPKPTDKVKVHYHGTNIDGSVFDSSVERGEPITFPLNRVIPGWTEGVQLMHVGDKFKFFIPQALAYGANSPSPNIKPYSTLIFEVELLGIE